MPAAVPRPLYLLDVQHSGYLGWGVWTREGYPEQWIEHGVERLRRHPHYHLGINICAQTYERSPAFQAQLKRWLARYGQRISICGGDYAQPTACVRTGEANLRHLLYGVEVIRRLLDYDVRVWIASEPGNFAQLPQVLTGLGYAGAFLKLHGPAQTGRCPSIDASKVYWVGPDGSRIAAIPEYVGDRGFRSRPDPRGTLNWSMWLMTRYRNAFGDQGDHQLAELLAWQQQYQAKGIEYVVMTKDDDNNDQPGNNNYIMTALDSLARDTAGDPRFQWVTPEEMLEIIPPPEAPEAHRPAPGPDYRPDPNLFETRAESVTNYGFQGSKDWVNDLEAEAWLQRADFLASLAHVLLGPDGSRAGPGGSRSGSAGSPEVRLKTAWKQHLIAQNHDVTLVSTLNLESYLQHEATRLARDVAAEITAELAARLDTSGGDRAIVVYNSLTWPRLDYVTARLPWGDEVADGALLDVEVAGDEGAVPHEVVGRTGDYVEVGFYAQVPALSYRVYSARLRPASATGGQARAEAGVQRLAPGHQVETPFYLATLALNGGLESLVERQSGRPVLGYRSGKLSADVDGKRVQSSGEGVVEVGPLSTRVRWRGLVGHKVAYSATTVFYHRIPRIETSLKLRANHVDGTAGGAIAGPEGRRLGVDYALGLGASPAIVRYQPFLAWPYEVGAPYFEPKLAAPFWVDFSSAADAAAGAAAGVTFLNRGTLGYYYRPEERDLQNVLFTGRLSAAEFTVGFVPHAGDWVQGEAQRRGLEFGYPLLVRVEEAHPGRLPRELRLLEVGARNVAPSSIFTQDGGLFLRLYEFEGRPAGLELGLGERLERATGVDLALRETGAGADAVAPYQIVTLRLHPRAQT